MAGSILRTNDDHDSFFDDMKEINGEYRGDAFIKFLTDDSSGIINGIATGILGDTALISLVAKLGILFGTTIANAQDVNKDIGKAYNKFASNADNVIYEDFLKEYLRNMPGLWALVPDEYYEDAKKLLGSVGYDFRRNVKSEVVIESILKCDSPRRFIIGEIDATLERHKCSKLFS